MRLFAKLLGVFLMVLVFTSSSFAKEVWKITSLDWQPYSGSNMASQGNSIQKLRELLKGEGIELIVEFYPWARAQKLAGQKDYVGYFPAWPEEVAEGFFASKAVDWSEIAVLTYKGSGVTWKSLEAIFADTVGLVGAYVYPEPIAKLAKEKAANVDMTTQEQALLRKLSSKRFKAAITDPSVMLYLAEKAGIDNIEVVRVLEKKELVIAFRNGADNKKRAELIAKLLAK